MIEDGKHASEKVKTFRQQEILHPLFPVKIDCRPKIYSKIHLDIRDFDPLLRNEIKYIIFPATDRKIVRISFEEEKYIYIYIIFSDQLL